MENTRKGQASGMPRLVFLTNGNENLNPLLVKNTNKGGSISTSRIGSHFFCFPNLLQVLSKIV